MKIKYINLPLQKIGLNHASDIYNHHIVFILSDQSLLWQYV